LTTNKNSAIIKEKKDKMLENATLKHEDCIVFLKGLPDNSIDLVAADPPYCSVIKDKWDNQWKNEEEYLDWCREWTEECFRVLKPGKCFYVWGTTKFDTFLRYKLDVLNKVSGANYQNWIIWHYDWGGRTKKNFARKHEDLLMYSKGEEFDFYPDNILVERAVKSNMAITRKMNLIKKHFSEGLVTDKDWSSWETYRFDKKGFEELISEFEALKKKDLKFKKGKIPTDVWMKNNHTTSKEYAGWHPTQKPLEIMDRIIKANTQPGDVVLDCFAGSGSTMISALRTGRKFVGCEFDESYIEKTWERTKALLGG
jgi:DNA modification methylase